MTLPLHGKRALVTGAGSGIGQATAIELGRRGANLCPVGVASCDEAAEEIVTMGRDCISIAADVGDENQAAEAVSKPLAALGGLDILVNCAGIIIEKSLLETTADEFDRIVHVNLRGVFLMGRESIAAMTQQGEGGRVINIASELAYLGRAEFSAYCATKSAILGLTRSWAREFAPDIPLGRVGRPGEIASVIAFLAGPEATFITGQTFSPNGGAVML